MQPDIKVERLARLRAEIETGAPLDEVLERENLTAEDWRAAGARWDAAMAEEAAKNRFACTNRYATALALKRKLLAAKRVPARAETPVSPRPVHDADKSTPRAPSPPAELPLSAIEASDRAAARPALSSVAPAPLASPPPIPAPLAVSLPPPPPAQRLAPRSSAAPPPPLPQALDANMGATMALVEGSEGWNEALPFLEAARAARAAGLPISPPPPLDVAARPPSPGPKPEMSGTLIADDSGSFMASEVLPFLKAAREAMAAGRPIPFPDDVDRPAGPQRAELSGTMGFDPSRAIAEALPFANAQREHAKRAEEEPLARSPRTLEQFAALTAEIASSPDQIARVRERWGMDEASHRAESERWQGEFARHPALFARYTELVKRLRQPGRGG